MAKRGQIKAMFTLHSIESNELGNIKLRARHLLDKCCAQYVAEGHSNPWLFGEDNAFLLDTSDALFLVIAGNVKNFGPDQVCVFIRFLKQYFPNLSGRVDYDSNDYIGSGHSITFMVPPQGVEEADLSDIRMKLEPKFCLSYGASWRTTVNPEIETDSNYKEFVSEIINAKATLQP